MTADSPLKIQPLEKYRATMTKEEVAKALGISVSHLDVIQFEWFDDRFNSFYRFKHLWVWGKGDGDSNVLNDGKEAR